MPARSPALKRFLRYVIVGGGTFSFDLALLAFLVEVAGMAVYLATPLAFLIAVSINYTISRLHVFRGTARSWHAGYGYFILVALVGAFLSTAGVAFFTHTLAVHYLIARVLIALLVGMMNYLINLRFNFKVMGHHP